MQDTPKPKRAYRSARRQEQARQTRLGIITAAGELFFERGYAGTTIEAIARQAGVSPESIYAVLGSKLAVLKALVQFSVVGDDAPTPLLERPEIASARLEMDQSRLIHTFATNIYNIMQRMSPIFLLLNAASKQEPDVQALLDKILADRLRGMRFFVEQLARIGPLRDGVDIPLAAETAWAVSSGEVFHLLTVKRGWSREQYTAWLADLLRRALLPG